MKNRHRSHIHDLDQAMSAVGFFSINHFLLLLYSDTITYIYLILLSSSNQCILTRMNKFWECSNYISSNMYFYYYYYFDDSNNLTSQACQCYWLIGLVLVILELGTCSIKNDRLSSRIVMDCEVVNHNRSISYIK